MSLNKKMNKAEVVETMKQAGMVFSEELTKAELIALYNAQVENNAQDADQTNKGEIEMTNNQTTENAEVIENVEALETAEAAVELENADVTTDADAEQDAAQTPENEAQADQENADAEKQIFDEEENKRAHGIGVQFYENGEFQQLFPSIQATARYMKKYVGRETMPYTPIHKSIREGIDWVNGDKTYKFIFNNPADKKDDYKTRTKSTSGSQGAGKLIDCYKDGEFVQQFPSIKAAVEFMKDVLKLPHNPYTAVNKSLKEDIDFGAYSFEFATQVRENKPQEVTEDAEQNQQLEADAAQEVTTENEEVTVPETELNEQEAQA